jgi:hypothetical protein
VHQVAFITCIHRDARSTEHNLTVTSEPTFITDKQFAKAAEVDRILATADYGEDYVPVDAGHQLKSEFTLHTSLPPQIKVCH